MENSQVDEDHYKNNYDQLPRWVSYYLQINIVRELKCDKILEIGMGNGLVSTYLKCQGLNVTTCDFDKSLKPDIVGDIRKLPFKKDNFDCICACEILEHIHYSDFETSLKELKRVSSKYVIISLPSPGLYFSLNFRFNGLKRLFKKELITLGFNIPPFYKNKNFDGQHWWEIGHKNYPLKKIVKDITKHFSIEKKFKNPIVPYHTFFLLRVK